MNINKDEVKTKNEKHQKGQREGKKKRNFTYWQCAAETLETSSKTSDQAFPCSSKADIKSVTKYPAR